LLSLTLALLNPVCSFDFNAIKKTKLAKTALGKYIFSNLKRIHIIIELHFYKNTSTDLFR
jgi:hypothetical protein